MLDEWLPQKQLLFQFLLEKMEQITYQGVKLKRSWQSKRDWSGRKYACSWENDKNTYSLRFIISVLELVQSCTKFKTFIMNRRKYIRMLDGEEKTGKSSLVLVILFSSVFFFALSI